MTIYVWPRTSLPSTRSFRLRSFNVQAVHSQSRSIVRGGTMSKRFEVKLTMPTIAEESWREHDGLISALGGIDGSIRIWDPARPEPRYNAEAVLTSTTFDDDTTFTDGTGFVEGRLPPFVTVDEFKARGANTLRLRGFPESTAGVLRRGDLFEIRPNGIWAPHAHLYVVTHWSRSNEDGKTLVQFEPGLRAGVRPGDMAVLGGGSLVPMSVFQLASDEEGEIEVTAPNFGSFGLTLLEVLPQQ